MCNKDVENSVIVILPLLFVLFSPKSFVFRSINFFVDEMKERERHK
ncbi:hypothetical protein X975_05988, partial [Stegodyphus mimosarum]